MQTVALINKFTTYLLAESSSDLASSEMGSASYSGSKFKFKKFKRFIKNSKYLPFAIVSVIVLIVLIFGAKNLAGNFANSPSVALNSGSDSRADLKKPLATQAINKAFSFPLKDATGKEVSKFIYEVEGAELRDEIIIKGQKAFAIKGRAFLILNLKITNSYDKTIQINAKDFVRLGVNNSSELLAPDIHNDPVEVQAISTKYTRLGFPINIEDTNLVLQVGEIGGSKSSININLK